MVKSLWTIPRGPFLEVKPSGQFPPLGQTLLANPPGHFWLSIMAIISDYPYLAFLSSYPFWLGLLVVLSVLVILAGCFCLLFLFGVSCDCRFLYLRVSLIHS